MSNQAANNSENNNVTLVLFHNDLRLADNATLLKASKISINGKLLFVYASSLTDILDDKDHYESIVMRLWVKLVSSFCMRAWLI
ncbi:hypothetical protein [uncultured Psychrobacter sp.]|uniref:hypothetical protein n=1 Tax=uncultured Psychrobacter sp. TaxID=259303 RepID=UPI0026288789|nr:hypothetical protein [uncultured Psychrobacter sp.]